jgi:glycosyltransferase involved in cell wall biosynthesis
MTNTNTIDKASVSVLVFTLNEELNLPTCLSSLRWCDDIVVVDSFSTDNTLDICRRHKVQVVQNAFTGFGDQRNFALQNIDLKHEWVLILDADERVPEELARELSSLANANDSSIAAYRLRRRFHLWGKWLRHSSLYPTWVVRFVRRGKVRYINRGHAETEEVAGQLGEVQAFLVDDNLKGLDAWFVRQHEYASKEAEYELQCENQSEGRLSIFSADPMKRRVALKKIAAVLPMRAISYFLYCYLFRMGFLDGRDGFVFCRMKAIYQNMIVVKKHDLRKSRRMAHARKIGTRT